MLIPGSNLLQVSGTVARQGWLCWQASSAGSIVPRWSPVTSCPVPASRNLHGFNPHQLYHTVSGLPSNLVKVKPW
jgi:hypothetical protein